MLLRFRVSNFRSLRDEQELSMVASSRDDRGAVIHLENLGLDVLRVAAIYGANAAGKSNVLAAFRFMCRAVFRSHRMWKPEGPVPREPFLLDPEARSRPSYFEVDFLQGGVRYCYGFKLDDEQVLEEWLYAYPHKRPQLWFRRDISASESFEFGKQLKGNHRVVAGLTRKNSLFLSVAAEHNHEALLRVYSWFSQRVRHAGVDDRSARVFYTIDLLNDAYRTALLDLVRLADLGVSDFSVGEELVPSTVLEFLRSASENSPEVAKLIDGEPKIPKLQFLHRTGQDSVAMAFEQESSGTQAWFAMAGPILRTLEQGSVLCVDELDASLHPRLAFEIIRIFEDPVRNPRGAQLIFNTHDTTLLGNLLGEPALRRDQVWFVEKDGTGATHLYPLTEFKPRKSENLERGYLQGRYGAVPFIEPALVEDA
jgi:hypothetical protein